MSVVPVAFSLLNDAGLEVMYHFGHLRAPLVRVEGVPLLSDVPQLQPPSNQAGIFSFAQHTKCFQSFFYFHHRRPSMLIANEYCPNYEIVPAISPIREVGEGPKVRVV